MDNIIFIIGDQQAKIACEVITIDITLGEYNIYMSLEDDLIEVFREYYKLIIPQLYLNGYLYSDIEIRKTFVRVPNGKRGVLLIADRRL